MTNAELAELRGELFGLKLLLFNFVASIAPQTGKPAEYVENLRRETLEGILAAQPSTIRPAHLETFRNAAAGIVAQGVEALAATYSRSRPPDELQ